MFLWELVKETDNTVSIFADHCLLHYVYKLATVSELT